MQPQIIIEPGGTRSLRNPAELFRSGELLLLLAWRDFRVRYRQTAIGAAWAIIEPLATACILTFLFHGVAKLDAGYPYTLFCYTGALAWTFFARILRGTSVSLVANAGLLSKAYFPRILLPASAAVVAFVDLILALAAFVPIAIVYRSCPGPALLLLPVWTGLAAVCGIGIGAALAVVNVRYRDVTHALPLLTQIWMFLTPVAFPLNAVPEGWRWLLLLNPLTGVVEGMRWSLLPGYPLDPTAVTCACIGAAATLCIGLPAFHVGERGLADVA